MALILKLVDGIPFMVDISTGGVSYDEEELLTSPLVANSNYTIPNSKTYNLGQYDLQVFVDGIAQRVGTDYQEVSTTQIRFPGKMIESGQRIRIRR
jgi:hypothetical protein